MATATDAKPRQRVPGEPPSLRAVSTTGKNLPSRTVLYATPGWGKSSLSCYTPAPIVLMTRGEDGLRTLLDRGLVPPTAHFEDDAQTWNEVLMACRELLVNQHEYKTLVLDTLNGAERLCVEHVTDKEYGGSSEKFAAYGKGVDSTVTEWLKLLDLFTRLRDKGMSIFLLAHSKIATFKSPESADYDRYSPDMGNKVWAQTGKWADHVLFGQLETFVQKDDTKAKKGKASGGRSRMLYCENTAVAEAKNRAGLPPEIHCGTNAEAAWAALAKALAAGRRTTEEKTEDAGDA